MYLTKLIMHKLREEPCPGWVFVGKNWTEKLKEKVSTIFEKYLDHEQHPSFNYWIIFRITDNEITAKRFTWESRQIGGSLEKLDDDLNKYYNNL